MDEEEAVRRYCAEQLRQLVEAMKPYVDGSFGDIMPGHVGAYVSALKELARLYAPGRPVSLDKAERMAAEAASRAVEAAVAAERERLALDGRLSQEAARDRVRAALEAVRR